MEKQLEEAQQKIQLSDLERSHTGRGEWTETCGIRPWWEKHSFIHSLKHTECSLSTRQSRQAPSLPSWSLQSRGTGRHQADGPTVSQIISYPGQRYCSVIMQKTMEKSTGSKNKAPVYGYLQYLFRGRQFRGLMWLKVYKLEFLT